MSEREPVDIGALSLPDELLDWIDGAPVYESSGQSGARTVFVDRGDGAYLKIAVCGSLFLAAQMQTFFARHRMSSPVLLYLETDRDYLLTAPLKGEDGTSEKHLSEPERLSEVFGQSLRRLHEADIAGCPVKDRMSGLLQMAETTPFRQTPFRQTHLNDIADYIGATDAEEASAEIAAAHGLIKNDALIHGDYCLPNIILNDWRLEGFIDVADGGVGDRHYDLAWGLWTLHWNLKSSRYGRRFLDAYGRDRIDRDRLRVCGLLSAME